jgi:hypothetical protein
MNRYPINSSTVFNRYDGKQVFYTTHYPKIPQSVNDIYIVANETDFLDSLAYKFYKDVTLWWVIAQANGIRGTLKAPTGSQIRIPQNIASIVANFSAANT